VPETQPGPVAPIGEVRRGIEFALRHVPRNKLILGVPRYGYEWAIVDGNAIGGRAISVAGAITLALRYQVPIQYSTQYEQAYLTYWDELGNEHIVWFEN